MLARLVHRTPALAATAGYAAIVAVTFWPFWLGRNLITGFIASDQRHVYPFRKFAVDYLKQYGDFAPWNPYVLGGMPFAANVTNGDTFYPGMLLRLFLPVDVGITLGFMLHIVLAGTFTFLFLRALKLDWGASFVGGAAYMFTGQLVSLVTAGHDGKLAVSAFLPLALLCLYRAVSRGAWRAYVGFGGVVALCLLSPHVQLTYYLLMAAGFFWLFMVVWSGERPPAHRWWQSAVLFAAGLALGFAIDAIQLIPFLEYVAHSPRGAEAVAAGASSTGWEYATSYAMPPEELFNTVWPSFSGMVENYWGRNFLKYHSEYPGVVALILASFGFGLADRRRMAWFFAFLMLYGVLFSLGGHTPFYRLPYYLLPGINRTRGAGMIFFIVSFGVAVLAAFGAQAMLRARGQVKRGILWTWLGILAVGAVLALAGGFKGIMLSFADPSRIGAVEANYGTFVWDAVRALALGLAVLGLLATLRHKRLVGNGWFVAVAALVLLDLWSVERRQIRFGPAAERVFAKDGVIALLERDRSLHRILPVNRYSQDNYMMLYGVRSVLGYQGTELHRYDELLGGKNVWRNLGNPNLWRLLAVKYVVVDRPIQVGGLEPVDTAATSTYEGELAYAYRYAAAEPFAFIVRQALKVPDDQVLPALMDSRFDPRRVVLVPPDAPIGEATLTALPEPVSLEVQSVQERPGRYRFTFAAPTAERGVLFVSEPWYPAWQATVDGVSAPVTRAQFALMAVPLPAGVREVLLEFRSERYRLGRFITVASVLFAAAVGASAWWAGRHGKRADA